MTSVISSFTYNISTVDFFKGSIIGIGGMFDSLGMLKTSDTGQVDVESIMAVPALNTTPHYEVRSWTDSIGPVFLRVEYGVGSSPSYPRMKFTFGTGSDGTGNLTGVITTIVVANSTGLGTVPSPHIASRIGSAFSMWLSCGANWIIHFDRRRDSNGLPVANQYFMAWMMYSGATWTGYLSCVNVPLGFSVSPSGSTQMRANFSSWSAGATYGTGIPLTPITADAALFVGTFPEISIQPGIVGFHLADLRPENMPEFSVTQFGVATAYKAIPTVTTPINYGAGTGMGIGILWDM